MSGLALRTATVERPNCSISNLFTLARLILAPFVAADILHDHYGRAIVFFFLAGISDVIDGFLARRLQASTPVGAYFDPIADKILLSVIYVSLGVAGAHALVDGGRRVRPRCADSRHGGVRLAVHIDSEISAVGVGKDQHFLSDCRRAGGDGQRARDSRRRSRWPFV